MNEFVSILKYVHMNNAVYHAIFDSVINVYLIRQLGLDVLSTRNVDLYHM